MSYPTTAPSYTLPDPSKTLDQDNHTQRHTQEEADIVALAGKLGVNASLPSSGKVLRATGSGASDWGQLDLSTDVASFTSAVLRGLLSDETGTGAAMFATAPTFSNPSITGGGSWTGSPSLSTPTIADHTNAQHDHSNAAGGGQIGNSGISGVSTNKLASPCKFSVSRSAAWTSGSPSIVPFDTKLFDTGSNVDIVTNKGRFTATEDGFYYFSAVCGISTGGGNGLGIDLYKNSGIYKSGNYFISATGGPFDNLATVSGLIQLVAGDYVEVSFYGSGVAGKTGTKVTFDGFLYSKT